MFYTAALATLLAMFCSPALSYPPRSTDMAAASPSPEPTCTITRLRQPSFETDCTFYQTTSTKTVLTDCRGCDLTTRVLGVGLPCFNITTIPGVAIKTVTACTLSETMSTGKPTSTAPLAFPTPI